LEEDKRVAEKVAVQINHISSDTKILGSPVTCVIGQLTAAHFNFLLLLNVGDPTATALLAGYYPGVIQSPALTTTTPVGRRITNYNIKINRGKTGKINW